MATIVHQIGNTKITVHSKSDVILLKGEEQREWFRRKQEEGDPVIKAIAETMAQVAVSSMVVKGA